ncbi:DUF3108 domain-containing protein [Paludibacterium yongneupense]|uniref:DUF3108 domain-containing protein n=1 Tax=Paludibacterium yongneupense TaxID=400061 RepID=UPI0004149ACA|nr:DUF3108 domain-containing protein [Paludibacterium yongneupense]
MPRRAPILMALALSLGVHLAVLGFDLLPLARSEQQETALKPLTARLQALTLDPAPKPVPTPVAPPKGSFSLTAAAAPPAPAAERRDTHGVRREAASQALAQTGASAAQSSSAPLAEAAATAGATSASAPASDATDDAAPASIAHLKHFPNSARLRYWVNNVGIATLDWEREGKRYSLETVANIAWFSIRYRSEGSLGRGGLKPDSFTAMRNGNTTGLARFSWPEKTLSLGDNDTSPLHAGTQDMLSIIYQVALLGAEGDASELHITNGRKVYPATLHAVGESDYLADGKKIHVVILRAQEQGGDTRIEFWLAPDYANQPVRIHFSGNVDVDLRARKIEINGKTEWDLPDPHDRKFK